MSSVKLQVSSPDTFSERLYDINITIEQLKRKLETATGIRPDSQILTLCRSESDPTVIRQLDDDTKALGFYSPENGMLIKVSDKDPSKSMTGQYTDVSQVEKFEMTPEEYERRQDTVLSYKKAHKMGRFAPAAENPPATPPAAPSHHIVVGSRCEVDLSGGEGLIKRGTVRFVGPTQFGKAGGEWIGVEYDEPVGKNDGSVEGVRYFTCTPKHGGFVRPDKVKVGDFPEEEIEVEEM
ncbi:hypothetical protein FS837_010743 [Tulasnella sp. UAMH 9824]|nr:hypothetical protein FS837_010743 [Tulasnella sp. UAMH 9824]